MSARKRMVHPSSRDCLSRSEYKSPWRKNKDVSL